MAAYIIYVASLILAIHSVTGIQPINGKVKITVGTTAGSSDTAKFIQEQLVDVYRQYSDSLDLEFVPWGRTSRDVTGALVCQFGRRDCWANKLHRCALNMLKGNQTAQLNYMACEYSSPFPAYTQATYTCAVGVGLRFSQVHRCMIRPSEELDQAAEIAARVPMQVINFVPSISLNDIHDFRVHNEAIQRLSSIIGSAFEHSTLSTMGFENTDAPWALEKK